MTMDPDSIGAVRRTVDGERVTLHVRGRRNALIGAFVVAVLPSAAIAGFVVVATRFARVIFGGGGGGALMFSATFMLGVVFALTAVACAVTFNPLRQLLRTALRGMTFTVDPRELRLEARGFVRDALLRWPRENVLDVVVRYRQSGIYQLHIVPDDRPPTVLLYGASEAELEFLASELRRAIGVNRLLRAAAGAWGDVAIPDGADHVAAAAVVPAADVLPAAPAVSSPSSSPQPTLQYAPESNDDIIRHRGAGSVRLLVPPLLPMQVVRANRWFVVLFAILAVAAAEPYISGWLRLAVGPLLILIVPVMAFCAGMVGWDMLKCLRHTSIDATADDLMLTVRWPILGRITTRWSVDAVRGIRAVDQKPPRVEFCLRSGRRETLAYLPTYAEAAELAGQLQRAQMPPLRLPPNENLTDLSPATVSPPVAPPPDNSAISA